MKRCFVWKVTLSSTWAALIHELLFKEVFHSWTKGKRLIKEKKGEGRTRARARDLLRRQCPFINLHLWGPLWHHQHCTSNTAVTSQQSFYSMFFYSNILEHLTRSALSPYRNWIHSSKQNMSLPLQNLQSSVFHRPILGPQDTAKNSIWGFYHLWMEWLSLHMRYL